MVKFVDHFWGERNKGFDELILNFKKSYLSIEEFHKFLIESGNVESTYCRLLSRLSSFLTHKFTTSSCFYPIGDALRQFVEEISSVHDSVIGAYQILIEQVAKYQLEQKQRQKQVKEEESRTAELITSLNTTYNNVIKSRQNYHTLCGELKKLQSECTYLTNSSCRLMDKTERKVRLAGEEYRSLLKRYEQIREQFEVKFTESCNKFQQIEEEHLARMKNFCIAYTNAALTCSENLRETRRKFIVKCDQLSIDNILLAFVHARKTGSDHPPKLEFEEFPEVGDEAIPKDSNGVIEASHSSVTGENAGDIVNTTIKGNSSGNDPFFHAIFMGFWRSRDSQKSRRRRSRKQLSSAIGEIGDRPDRPKTTDPSKVIRPAANVQKRFSAEWEDSSSFISSHTNPNNRAVSQPCSNPNSEKSYKWSSSSLSSSDDEDRLKLCVQIKPIQNNEKNETDWQNLESIKRIFSENKPRMQHKRRFKNTDDERTRCMSAVPFQEIVQSPTNQSKTAPSTPVCDLSAQSSRSSWLEGSQDTLCPKKTESGSLKTLVQDSNSTGIHQNIIEQENNETDGFTPFEDDPWTPFNFTRSMSTVSTLDSDQDFSTCSSLASSPVPIVRRMASVPCEIKSLGIGLIEQTVEGSFLNGALVFSFTSSSISQLRPISFTLSGLDKVSKIMINRGFLVLRKVEQSQRQYEVRIDKLQTALRSKVSQSNPFVNINLIRYQISTLHLSQWMFIDFSSKVCKSQHINEIQITPIEHLLNFVLSMILPCQTFSNSGDENWTYKSVQLDENEEIQWFPAENDLFPGRTYRLQFITNTQLSLNSVVASFVVNRTTLKWEASQPFGSTVRFALNEDCRNYYQINHLHYKAKVDKVSIN